MTRLSTSACLPTELAFTGSSNPGEACVPPSPEPLGVLPHPEFLQRLPVGASALMFAGHSPSACTMSPTELIRVTKDIPPFQVPCGAGRYGCHHGTQPPYCRWKTVILAFKDV